MDKFTKVVKVQDKAQVSGEKEIVYENDYMKVKTVNGWSYVLESDRIVVLPYVKEEGYVFLRSEVVPPWSDKYKGKELGKTTQFLTVISGTIDDATENGIQSSLRRELYEGAGIAMTQFYNFDIEGPFFIGNSTSQVYLCLMEMSYTDYKMVSPPENTSKILRVSIADLDEIKINDLSTKILIDKLKNDYNL